MLFRILQIAIPFVWLGFICAISFMEAPLKFRAPNITLELGLGIGYLVFQTLNKVEIVLCVAYAISFWRAKPQSKVIVFSSVIIAAILFLQTFWMFPLLDQRTILVTKGTAEPFSYWHIVYIVFDSVKVLLLVTLGVDLIRRNLNHEGH